MKPFGFHVSLTWIAHALLIGAQLANFYSAAIPAADKPYLMIVIGALQGAQAVAAHYSQPPGS